MLTLTSLSYRHAGAERASLRDVDLRVDDGEVVGIVGPNEAGKTSLSLILAGLAPRIIGGHMGGVYTIDGTDTAGLPMHAFPAMVGIAFDDPANQLSGVTTTVFEEVAFGPANLSVPRDELIERVEAALAALAITGLQERDPARLSGGQQQLVAIASILAMRPPHLVMDEPTAQLDPAGTSLVGEAIERLTDQGVSIVLVEHKTDLVARVASRVIVLDGGRVALEGPTAEVLADPRLPELGVSPPSEVRLRRLAAAAGVSLPAGALAG